jgi:hypothetical protein
MSHVRRSHGRGLTPAVPGRDVSFVAKRERRWVASMGENLEASGFPDQSRVRGGHGRGLTPAGRSGRG